MLRQYSEAFPGAAIIDIRKLTEQLKQVSSGLYGPLDLCSYCSVPSILDYNRTFYSGILPLPHPLIPLLSLPVELLMVYQTHMNSAIE